VETRRWLMALARRGGVLRGLSIALPLAGGALLLLQAGLLAHVLHRVIALGDNVASVVAPVVVLGATLALRAALGLGGEICGVAASERSKLDLRRALVENLLDKPPVWTAARASGALSTAIVEQVEAMDGYLTRYLPAMAQAALLPLAFAVVMLPVDWVVALLFLISAPLIPVFMALAGFGAEAASRQQAAALGRLGGYFADRLRGLTTLKLFGRDTAEVDGMARASDELRVRTLRVMRIAFLSSAVLEFFAALGVAGVALYTGLSLLGLVNLRLTPLGLEAALFCLLMAPEVYQPLRLLAAHYHDQAAARAAATEIAAQLGSLPETFAAAVAAPVMPEATSATSGASLRLADFGVAAPDGRPVLAGADLAVAPGERIAIIGRSGIGKSTLLEAIAGLRPHEGTMALDIAPARLRAEIGVLGQRPTLFAGSIADNIRLGRRDACDTAIHIAARRARVMDFAAHLPDGLDTMLGEAGLGLSGGEVHRVALARLYLRNPRLLLLDEPTAHLDELTEQLVLDGLTEFARGRTLIVATHSPAVAARMDHCYRIAEGRLLAAPRPKLPALAQRGAA
jgi:ATP-binding cassette subfamily C protein CydD